MEVMEHEVLHLCYNKLKSLSQLNQISFLGGENSLLCFPEQCFQLS